MPEIKIMQITAREVHVGDQLKDVQFSELKTGMKVAQQLPGTPNRVAAAQDVVITDKSNGSANTTITTNIGRIIITSDALVLVGRSVPTTDELEAKWEEQTEYLLDKFITDIRATANADPLAHLNTKMEGYAHDVARGLAWCVEDTMVMSHRKALAANLLAWLERDEASDEPVGRREVILEFCVELEKQMVRDAQQLFNSSSVVSNLSNMCELKARATYLDSFQGAAYLRARLSVGFKSEA